MKQVIEITAEQIGAIVELFDQAQADANKQAPTSREFGVAWGIMHGVAETLTRLSIQVNGLNDPVSVDTFQAEVSEMIEE